MIAEDISLAMVILPLRGLIAWCYVCKRRLSEDPVTVIANLSPASIFYRVRARLRASRFLPSSAVARRCAIPGSVWRESRSCATRWRWGLPPASYGRDAEAVRDFPDASPTTAL